MSNTPRRYRLMKDLPDAKAGTIFTHDGGFSYDYKSYKYKENSWYNETIVENSPEWFAPEEIKEESIEVDTPITGGAWNGCTFEYGLGTTKRIPEAKLAALPKVISDFINKGTDPFDWVEQFQWSDELIVGLMQKSNERTSPISRTECQLYIHELRDKMFSEYIKKTKTPQPASSVGAEDEIENELNKLFPPNKQVMKDICQRIFDGEEVMVKVDHSGISVVHNPPFPPPKSQTAPCGSTGQFEKDWEVLIFKQTDREKCYWAKLKDEPFYKVLGEHPTLDLDEMLTNSLMQIHSVRRKSDGEVFTVGDFIRVVEPVRKGWSDPITGFVIIGNDMVSQFETWRQPLKDIERMHKDIHQKDAEPGKDWQPLTDLNQLRQDAEKLRPTKTGCTPSVRELVYAEYELKEMYKRCVWSASQEHVWEGALKVLSDKIKHAQI